MSNEMNKVFEIATRKKYRFEFRGLISVEDLWDLDLENLDSIYRKLKKKIKVTAEESLLAPKNTVDPDLFNKTEIIKYIVLTKLEEQEKAQKAQENKAKKQKILAIIAEKQDNEIKNKSIDELNKLINDLD